MKPIFVVGNSRSGTSMMGRILGNHPLVYTIPHELHFFEELWDPTQGQAPLSYGKMIDLLSRLFCIAAEGYLKHGDPVRYRPVAEKISGAMGERNAIDIYRLFLMYIAQTKGCEYVCDQTPNYLLFSEDILSVFPECFIINMVRDPRDILLSQKNKWRIRGYGNKDVIPLKESIRSWINYHPYTMSLIWKRNLDIATTFQDHSRFISIRYEDLVVSPTEVMLGLCDRLGLGFKAEMLYVGVQGSSTTVPDPSRKGVADFRNKWKKGGLSMTEIIICERVTGAGMVTWGYDLSGIKPNLVSLFGYLLLFLLKTPAAVALNLQRTKNIWQAIGRRLGTRSRSTKNKQAQGYG